VSLKAAADAAHAAAALKIEVANNAGNPDGLVGGLQGCCWMIKA
jgi:hypothetical protein